MTDTRFQPGTGDDVRAVALAICKSRTCEGVSCCQWPANMGRTNCNAKNGGYDDAARAAIAVLSSDVAVAPGEPVAWSYELATNKTTFPPIIYAGWERRISRDKPNVTPGSIRDLTPLYALPSEAIGRDQVIAQCAIIALEQRCERGTPWDLACTTSMNAMLLKETRDRLALHENPKIGPSKELFDKIDAALRSPDVAPAQSEPSHVMCIGWPTIARLMTGEAVWFDDLQCGAIAASDLRASPGKGVSREDIATIIREGFEAPPDDWPETKPWADGALGIADEILRMFAIPMAEQGTRTGGLAQAPAKPDPSKAWTREQFWEFAEGLTDSFDADLLRNTMTERGLCLVSSTDRRDPVLHDERFPSASAVTSTTLSSGAE